MRTEARVRNLGHPTESKLSTFKGLLVIPQQFSKTDCIIKFISTFFSTHFTHCLTCGEIVNRESFEGQIDVLWEFGILHRGNSYSPNNGLFYCGNHGRHLSFSEKNEAFEKAAELLKFTFLHCVHYFFHNVEVYRAHLF